MASQAHHRPYRSHLRPACQACRQRKSRCKVDDGPECLMCRVHGTQCLFARADAPRKAALRDALSSAQTPPAPAPPASTVADWPTGKHQDQDRSAPDLPFPLDHADEEESPHIVGPAITDDSSVLADYLATIPDGSRNVRTIRTIPGSNSGPVMFTTVRKHPVGMPVVSGTPASKCRVIEKLLEPWLPRLADLYFAKVNTCLPLLDEVSFRKQYLGEKHRISPALLSCLYAHAMAFWRYDDQLATHHCPDIRFVWNLANEALYAELHLSPSVSTITAILLNIGGRPTTSMIGNGVQLGSAVSLSHSLGLNRNPLSWDIPQSEKHLRMQIWWCLVIYDRWCSLAYGTPPHIRRSQYDVPLPKLGYICPAHASKEQTNAAQVFIALASLTEVLDFYLEQTYRVAGHQDTSLSNLELSLNQWIESLDGGVRKIVVRGTRLDVPGAANLRLAYLSVELLLRRIELNAGRDNTRSSLPGSLTNQYMRTRRTVEYMVMLVQELQPQHLADFWLPTSAFAFASATTFLLRCALEIDRTSTGVSGSPSLRMASNLLDALRSHRDKHGWDLGDLCLAQYSEVVAKLLDAAAVATTSLVPPFEKAGGGGGIQAAEQPFEIQQLPLSQQQFLMMPTSSVDLDQWFPNIWDTLQSF